MKDHPVGSKDHPVGSVKLECIEVVVHDENSADPCKFVICTDKHKFSLKAATPNLAALWVANLQRFVSKEIDTPPSFHELFWGWV